MKRVLHAECIKILNTRYVWAMCLAYGVLFFASASVISNFFGGLHINGSHVGISMLNGPDGWLAIAWIGRWFSYLLGFVLIQMVCMEFEYGTDRQNIIDGFSPLEFFAGKLSVLLGLCLLATVFFVMIAFSNAGGSINFQSVIGFAINCAGTLGLALMFAFLCRRSGIAGFLFVSYPLILEPVLAYVARQYGLHAISRYLPAEVFSGLTSLGVFHKNAVDVVAFADQCVTAIGVLVAINGVAYGYFVFSDR